MPFDALTQAVPALDRALASLPPLQADGAVWPLLRRLLAAPAPSGGANLPGAVGEVIGTLVSELGLGERWMPELGTTGNAALWIGANAPSAGSPADIVVVAHMDRPSFRVRAPERGDLVPICANRFPEGEERAGARALRFVDGRLVTAARGVLVSRRVDGHDTLTFEVAEGMLAWQDTVVLDAEPQRGADGSVTGTGLDNALGVLTALLAAAALARVEDALRERNAHLLIVFSDQEEGPPDAFFGHGAARLTHTLPPPRGVVVVDAHGAAPEGVPRLGAGVSHGTIAGWGRGSIVPPNFHALALDLAAGVNAARPGTVQFNTGYLSRSDDLALGRWAKILALTGPPMAHAHTAREMAHLSDLRSGAAWLAYFLAATLNLAPELSRRYALGA